MTQGPTPPAHHSVSEGDVRDDPPILAGPQDLVPHGQLQAAGVRETQPGGGSRHEGW